MTPVAVAKVVVGSPGVNSHGYVSQSKTTFPVVSVKKTTVKMPNTVSGAPFFS